MRLLNQSRLGELLVSQNKISAQQLQHALEQQKLTGKKLGEVLTDLGLVSRQDLLTTVAQQLGVSYWDLRSKPADPKTCRVIPSSLARKHQALPVRIADGRVVLAMENPDDIMAQEEIRLATGLEVEPVLADPAQLKVSIEQIYSVIENAEKAMEMLQLGATAEEPPETADDSSAPITRVVEGILHRAVHQNASDIHIEPQDKRLRVRFRIDGSLEEVMSQPISLHASITTRIKVMANMDIAEKRLPQDSRFSLIVNGKPYDFRIATMPTEYGEKIACRILDKSSGLVALESLGMPEVVLGNFKEILASPFGMILVTGPTGSGKSTTLAAALNYLNTVDKNIITIEDPVEYIIPGANQSQVQPKVGLTFSLALKHFLRQDPDIIMVGEIRDQDTARIAVTSALTGHILLSTLHTNDAASSLTRLKDMGIEPFLVASSVRGILAQRLVRLLCNDCKEPYAVSDEVAKRIGVKAGTTYYRPVGCPSCRMTGYNGRTGIYELMVVNDEVRSSFLSGAEAQELRRIATKNGMKTMFEDGLQKVSEGLTSLEEVLRVSEGGYA